MADLHAIVSAARELADRAVAAARELTRNGEAIDEHQVHSERLAYLATETAAVEALLDYAAVGAAHDPLAVEEAIVFTAMVAARARAQLGEHLERFGLSAPRFSSAGAHPIPTSSTTKSG